LCSADILGSLEPREVITELEGIAKFLEIPEGRARRLTSELFVRPQNAEAMPDGDQNTPDMLGDGPLVEGPGRNILLFEEALASLTSEECCTWKGLATPWMESRNSVLTQLGWAATMGSASAPRLSLVAPMRGEAAHAGGTCRPCVFAMRNACRFGEDICAYCHVSGHTKKNRLNPARRHKQRGLQRLRTPSPEDLLALPGTEVPRADTIHFRAPGHRRARRKPQRLQIRTPSPEYIFPFPVEVPRADTIHFQGDQSVLRPFFLVG